MNTLERKLPLSSRIAHQCKKSIRALTPPVLMDMFRPAQGWRMAPYPSYQAVVDASDGYQQEDIVRVVVEKNRRYQAQLTQHRTLALDAVRTIGCLASMAGKNTLRVLDFGGGGGAHYAMARCVLPKEIAIRWHVVETPAMCAHASKVLAHTELCFYDDIVCAAEALGGIDCVYSSCALQYTPNPMASLTALVALKAPHLCIVRSLMSNTPEETYALQQAWLSGNGPGPLPKGFEDRQVSYPLTIPVRAEIEACLRASYDIRYTVEEDKHVCSIGPNVFNMYGYFCDLRSMQ